MMMMNTKLGLLFSPLVTISLCDYTYLTTRG